MGLTRTLLVAQLLAAGASSDVVLSLVAGWSLSLDGTRRDENGGFLHGKWMGLSLRESLNEKPWF
jgi:hypothetical protein